MIKKGLVPMFMLVLMVVMAVPAIGWAAYDHGKIKGPF